MRLTLRGWTAVAVVAAAVWLAWQYGPRALNAVVAPLVVVLVVGLATTLRADRPAIRRAPVAAGFIGERRRVEVDLETDAAVAATVRDDVPDGCTALEIDAAGTGTLDDGTPVAATTLEGDDRFAHEIRIDERGEHRLGPLTITVSDVLGLVERRFTYEESTTVLGYPIVRDLRAGPDDELGAFVDAVATHDREAFDHLRQYQRGDPLRDVHWKSAAKRPDDDLVVTEYAADDEHGAVTVAAEGTPARADELASAAASVATYLLEFGVDVGVTLPDRDVEPGTGREHHRDVLAMLATYGGGELEGGQRDRADLLIQADAEGTRLVVDGRTTPFGRFVGDGAASDGAESPRRDRSGDGGSEVVA